MPETPLALDDGKFPRMRKGTPIRKGARRLTGRQASACVTGQIIKTPHALSAGGGKPSASRFRVKKHLQKKVYYDIIIL